MNEHLLLVMLINVGKLQWLSCLTLFNWQYFDDNSFGREILNIVTLCLYKDAGCQWMDAVKNAEVSSKITLILDKLIKKMSSKSWSKDCLKCFFFIGLSNNSETWIWCTSFPLSKQLRWMFWKSGDVRS